MTKEEKEGSIKGMILHSVHKVMIDSKHDISSIENTLLFADDIAEKVFKSLKLMDFINIK